MALSITKELESTLRLAFAEAKARRHEHVTLEHLLYALLRDPIAARILRACGARLPELKRELEQVIDEVSEDELHRVARRRPLARLAEILTVKALAAPERSKRRATRMFIASVPRLATGSLNRSGARRS